jgi:hypothetical protein
MLFSFNSMPKSWVAALAGVLAVTSFTLILGCNSSVPPVGAYAQPATVVNRSRVDEFNSNEWQFINPDLFELNNPSPNSSGISYALKDEPPLVSSGNKAAFMVVNNFPALASAVTTGNVQGPGLQAILWDSSISAFVTVGSDTESLGANGDLYAFHENAAVTDLQDFEYPAIDLQAQFEGGNFYDASDWHGVQFMMKVGPGDTATHRTFSIPVYQTQAVAGGGGCTAGPKLCYDHFAADYSAGTGGQWKQFNYLFSDLHQLVAGAIPNPPTLSGVNLQQVLWLQWEEGRNNLAGISTIDLWIDQIEFY